MQPEPVERHIAARGDMWTCTVDVCHLRMQCWRYRKASHDRQVFMPGGWNGITCGDFTEIKDSDWVDGPAPKH